MTRREAIHAPSRMERDGGRFYLPTQRGLTCNSRTFHIIVSDHSGPKVTPRITGARGLLVLGTRPLTISKQMSHTLFDHSFITGYIFHCSADVNSALLSFCACKSSDPMLLNRRRENLFQRSLPPAKCDSPPPSAPTQAHPAAT